MKIRNIWISLCACSVLLLTGCDNYLDIPPTGSVIPTTVIEYRALIAKAYSGVPTSRGLAAFRSDELVLNPKSSYDMGSFGDIERWNDASPAQKTTSFHWEDLYNVIFISNHIIENKKTITEGTTEEVNQLTAEAYMLRGYMHFLLVNLYGQPYSKPGVLNSKSIPLKLNTDIEEIPTRNTLREVYESIVSDVASADELMNVEAWEPRFSYRFNKASVQAFRSRLALYMEQWDEVLLTSDKALKINGTLEDLTLPEAQFPNHYKSVEMITALEYVFHSNYQTAVFASPTLLAAYDEAHDLRLPLYYDEADEDGNIVPLKGGNTAFRSTFRAAELYLNAAEAAARLGDDAKAKGYLLQLMEKRFTADGFTAKKQAVDAMQGEALINEILNERFRELAFEGHRWFDLRRTTRPQIIKTLERGTFTLSQDDARYTIPIPKDAITSNPGLLN
jgi:hypothetical protein